MENWSKKIIDFGKGKLNETKIEQIQYLGNENLTNKNFSASCVCTSPSYDPIKKILTLGLHLNTLGLKTGVITVNFPNEKQDLLLLKATVE
jgi:hypothetical protein